MWVYIHFECLQISDAEPLIMAQIWKKIELYDAQGTKTVFKGIKAAAVKMHNIYTLAPILIIGFIANGDSNEKLPSQSRQYIYY